MAGETEKFNLFHTHIYYELTHGRTQETIYTDAPVCDAPGTVCLGTP